MKCSFLSIWKSCSATRTLFPVLVALLAFSALATVTLTQSTIDYHHQDIKLNANRTVASTGGQVTTTYKSLVLDNEYITIKLVPDYGARVISMIYKPTGHEEIWSWNGANSQGIGQNSFYYDWLMVWGGIFPTLSAPEHGKYWNLPFAYKIVKQTADTVSITMSQVDTVPFRSGYAGKFSSYGATGMKCDFTVTLVSKQTGFGVDVVLTNPNSNAIQYEYWTCTTMSPGSPVGNLKLTQNAEFIIPDDTVNIPSSWGAIRGKEQSVGGDKYILNALRWWKNWPDMGIVYAQPKANFWGCINHDDPKEEGIMRVCDNKITYTTKMWTWGINGLPYFEPWGGLTDQFFSKATLSSQQVKQWHEFYTPTVGLSKVTDASERIIANITTDKTKYDGATNDSVRVTCQMYTIMPDVQVRVRLTLEGGGAMKVLYDNTVTPDTKSGNLIKASVPVKSVYNGVTKLVAAFTDNAGTTLLTTTKPLSFVNGSLSSTLQGLRPTALEQGTERTAIYSLDGKLLRTCNNPGVAPNKHIGRGVYLLMQNRNGRSTIRPFTVQ
jgi:hypothetical protein